MVLSGNKQRGLSRHDLESLNGEGFDHSKTLLSASKLDKQSQNERDVKSEFDYGQKKKFTDVLSDTKSRKQGLKGLEEL
jgi:hypothetical protein